jgi:hypothetical protein
MVLGGLFALATIFGGYANQRVNVGTLAHLTSSRAALSPATRPVPSIQQSTFDTELYASEQSQYNARSTEVGMSDYQDESWVSLYQSAILELEHAKMLGRIEAARSAIVARVEKLHDMPGLHADERQAIADALSGLRVVQDEDERYNEDQKRHAVERALEKLRCIAPTILKTAGERENPD